MNPGIEHCASRYSVEETVERVQTKLREKGITVFCVIDHDGGATAAGLTMPPTKVVIFGNPKAGTPVMVAAPSAALDLPMKILVAEGANGAVTVSWSAPHWLAERHEIPQELVANLMAAEAMARSAAGA